MSFPSPIGQTLGEIPIFRNFLAKLSKNFNFGLYFTENQLF